MAAPLVGGQQAGRVYRVGFLFSGTPGTTGPALNAFKDALRGLGWIEGRNIVIELRYAEGDQSRMPGLARDLLSQGVDIILPNSTPATLAANEVTRTIPIVMVGTLDAQLSGVVKDLARPGGNITGLTQISVQLVGKRLSLLKEAVPTATRLGFLTARRGNPASTWAKTWDLVTRTMETEAQRLGMELHTIAAFGPEQIKASFAGFEAARVNALYVLEGSLAVHRALIADLALKARLPTMFGVPTYVEAGGLLSYGAGIPDRLWPIPAESVSNKRGFPRASASVRIGNRASPADRGGSRFGVLSCGRFRFAFPPDRRSTRASARNLKQIKHPSLG